MASLCLVRIVFFHIFGHRGVNFGLSERKNERKSENGKLFIHSLPLWGLHPVSGGGRSGERFIHPLRRFAPRPPPLSQRDSLLAR